MRITVDWTQHLTVRKREPRSARLHRQLIQQYSTCRPLLPCSHLTLTSPSAMASQGKAASVKNGSVQALVTALVTNAGILLIEVGAFMILRRHIRKIYAPRTYLPPPRRRSPDIGKGYLSWIPAIIKTPATDIIHKNGLDAYFFLRLLRVLLKLFVVTTVVAFAVLVPVNIAGIPQREQQLKGYLRISWGNIPDRMSARYTAHVVVSYTLAFYIFYLLRQELLHLVNLRHRYLISKHHSRKAQARTVLVTGVPKELLTEKHLREFTSFVPGGVNNIWIYRESKILSELYEDRQTACEKLESAVTQVLRRATKVQNKRVKRALKKGVDVPYPTATRALLDELVPPKHRPKHRLGMLGLVGKKVDTIDWAKAVIPDLDRRISDARHDLAHVQPAGSAFIEFNLQLGAHVMDQCVSYHEPLKMSDKWTEVAAEDIVWANIDDGSYETRARFAISWLATIGLIIGYAPLVSFAGTISNISTWCTRAKWLAWICKVPDVALGLIQGVVPPLVIAILFFLVPFILRALAWFECVPRYTLVSQRVYTRYFLFLVVHGFIVTTLSSSLIAAIPQVLDRPSEAVRMLANNLPQAGTYFLTYIISTGFTGAGMAFLQLVPLILHYVKKWLFGRTPREAYSVSFIMPAVDFGVIIPPISLLATIGLSYAVINPLMNVVALIATGLLWFAYKYLFLYVMDQPEQNETGGLYYPKAISNVFAGLYIQQVTVAGLLFLRLGIDGARVASAIQGAFMVILVFLTFGAQVMLHNSFDDIVENLPMSLATKGMRERYEQERKKSGLESLLPDDIDLFNREHIRAVVKHRLKQGASRLHMPSIPSTQLHIPKALKSGTSSHSSAGSPSSPYGSSTAVNRHPSAPQPNITVTSPPPPPPPPFVSHHSQPSAADTFVRESHTDADDDDDADVELDEHAFDHPATYKPAPWIWVPRDPLGLSSVIVEELNMAGVSASDTGATVDKHGVVKVSRNPPDEEWEGGIDI